VWFSEHPACGGDGTPEFDPQAMGLLASSAPLLAQKRETAARANGDR